MVGNVMIDLDTITIGSNYIKFTLNWTEPFANFDPIVNYFIIINCTVPICPLGFINDNVSTSATVHFITDSSMMITPLSVIAINTIGSSNPAAIVIVGK